MQPPYPTKGPNYPSSIFGSAGENVAWRVVYRAYMEDRVEAAMQAALDLGTGPTAGSVRFYRQLEAEAETRKQSTLYQTTSWLQVEHRPVIEEAIRGEVLRVIEATAARFGFTERPPTIVSVLISEVDTPWAVGRAGYFVDKIPYDKVCLPEAALQSREQFTATLSHEFAHAIALHLAEGHAPRWLNEAFATLSEGYPIERAVHAFHEGRIHWRTENDLNTTFVAEDSDGYQAHVQAQAYGQAAIMGRYLQSLKGDEGFANLLRGFSNNSRWKDLAMSITGQEPVDEALREVFGFGVRELFERAKP